MTEYSFFKGSNPNGKKTHEKMLTMPGHEGYANQNHFKIPLTLRWLGKMWTTRGAKWYTVLPQTTLGQINLHPGKKRELSNKQ
jgi:hypothetical protein